MSIKCNEAIQLFVWTIIANKKLPYRRKPRKNFSQVYTNLDTSSGRLTNHHSRTLRMVYSRISRVILAATCNVKRF